MKAAVFYEHGDASVIQYREVELPEIRPDEVKIEVHYASLNRLDIFVRNGSPALKIPLPHISGSDFTGRVVEVGSKVKEVTLGAKVAVNAAKFCGKCQQCLRGEQSLCRNFSMVGEHSWGGLAEYAIVPARNLQVLPEEADCRKIAAGTLTTLTAWRMLSSLANVRPGNTVLIPGAGGGLSTAAIQIAKYLGAKVIVTTSKKEEVVKALGADYVINYIDNPNWSNEVWKYTKKKGVDVVFESVGEATWEQSLRSLAKGGVLVTAGATTGFKGKTNIGLVFWKQLRIMGSTMANRREFEEAIHLLLNGTVEPVIDSEFTLEETQEAEKRLEVPDRFGKVLIRVRGCQTTE